MNFALAVVLAAASAASASSPEKTVKPATPSQTIAEFVQFQAPQGWEMEEHANEDGADQVLSFSSGLDQISVRLFGAPGSAYKNPTLFLRGPAATTMGRAPEKKGVVKVAGRSLELFRRAIPLELGDPHVPSTGSQMMGREVFCVLPLSKGRFAMLSLSRESPAPDMEGTGEKVWRAFLGSVKLPVRKGKP